MPEAKFVPPRKCPNCGQRGRKVILHLDLERPDLGRAKESAGINNDFDCSKCGKGFCGVCFIPDYEGEGHAWHCPHCKELLAIPIGINYKPMELN